LDAEQRAALAEFVTPRTNSDGEPERWPVDEVGGGHD
jgi:hypothetical protein